MDLGIFSGIPAVNERGGRDLGAFDSLGCEVYLLDASEPLTLRFVIWVGVLSSCQLT
jgi:hypothetical protein